MGINNVSTQPQNVGVNNLNVENNQKRYFVNPNAVDKTPQSDTVQLSTKNDKLKKIGIGTAIAVGVAGIGTAVYFLTRGKVGSKSVRELAEHIEFKPAKTIEEAKVFAKDKLGVSIIDDMSLDVMNYVNEGLHILKNKHPNDFKIKWIESKGIGGGYDTDALAQLIAIKNKNIYGINLSSDYIKNIDKTLTEFINGEVDRQALVKINEKLQYNDFFKKASISNEVSELANKFRQNPSSLSFKEKVKLHMGLEDIAEEMDKLFIEHNGDISKVKDVVNIISSPFHPIIHEQGHILHRINVNNRFDLLDVIEILNQKKLDTTIYNEFKSKYSSIASRVSEYATESPAEFVAEVYAKTLEGAKFDNDVLSLYAKYGGHSIS